MKLQDFIAAMERIAPPELAMEFDNVGLLIGTDRPEIKTQFRFPAAKKFSFLQNRRLCFTIR